MKESLDQHAGHRPAPSTGSRQVAQSCGSATSRTRARLARKAAATLPRRRTGTWLASMSPCMGHASPPPSSSGDLECAGAGERSRLPIRTHDRGRHGCLKTTRALDARPLPLSSTASCVRARQRRAAALGSSNFSDRPRGGGFVRSPGGGAAPLRLRRRPRDAHRCRPPRARRQRKGRHHHRGRCCCASPRPPRPAVVAAGAAQPVPLRPMRRRCRFATPRSIWSCRCLRFNSSTICPARSSRSAARSNPTACCSRRSLGGDTLIELRQAFAAAEAEIEDGVSPRVRRSGSARHGRAAATGGFRAAGDRRRPDHGALCVRRLR